MNTPKAILIGFAMVATAVYFSRDVGPAQAATGSLNYSITGIDNNHFVLLDNNKNTFTNCRTIWSQTPDVHTPGVVDDRISRIYAFPAMARSARKRSS